MLFTITYSTGINRRFNVVAAIIPPNTVVPTDILPARPAPRASTSGTTPRINANDVIKIGRSRIRAASMAASTIVNPVPAQLLREFHDQDCVLARKPDQHHQSDLAIHVILQSPHRLRPNRTQNRHGHGHQHDERKHESFRTARPASDTRPLIQVQTESALSARLNLLQRKPAPFNAIPCGSTFFDSASIAAIPSPELCPGAADPSISAERNKL